LDRVLTHKFWGYVISSVFCLVFSIYFVWSEVPMDFIDSSFASLSAWSAEVLPAGMLTNLISQGIIPGIGGILIFIPQIAFCFVHFDTRGKRLYESCGLFDGQNHETLRTFRQKYCAINFWNGLCYSSDYGDSKYRKLERTFDYHFGDSVYDLFCAFASVRYHYWVGDSRSEDFGDFNLQGLTLMLLYLLGFGMAIFSAYVLNKLLKIKGKSYFIVEMPNYKLPLFKNVGINVIEKTKAFVFGAGKIILAISIILWFLASYGPGENFSNAEQIVVSKHADKPLSATEFENEVASQKLENSYIGLMGKSIEPVLTPLGYDWKIGIAIISSFAAREVFVGTLATIYSVGDTDNEDTIKNKMQSEINPLTGEKVFNFASGISLLLFYAFAMQCVSTLAVTRKETNSWRWPLGQLLFMSAFAYTVALVAYQLLS